MIYTVTLNPALDRTLTVSTLKLNEVIRAKKVSVDCGGKGFNVSRALKLLGGESTILGFIGGAAGFSLEDGLRSMHLTTDFIRIKGETRTNFVVTEEETAKHIKVNEPGPIISESEQQELIIQISNLARPADLWVFSGSLPPGIPSNFYARLISIIHTKEAKACLDTSGEALQKSLSAQPFIIKPNKQEAEEALEISIKNRADQIEAAKKFHAKQIPWVAISFGGDGLLLSDETTMVHTPAPSINVVNSVGAGDALLAGLLWAYSQGKGISEMAAWGVATGSCAARKDGVNFGSYDEVKGMFESIKKRVTIL